MADYNDEIDLYGDVEEGKTNGGISGEKGSSGNGTVGANSSGAQNNDGRGNSSYSTIPTFISEARGGSGIIPYHSDDYGNSNNQQQNQQQQQRQGSSQGRQGSAAGQDDGEGGPSRGEYGQPGQWKTKPVSTVRPSDMPEEGKMFVGGLNWETTEDSMRSYFEQFGEVTHCTIMRDPATDRSRGFGFLTFADSKAVNTVMVKEHHLDGKIIDPKRAIPRPDTGIIRNDKLFVRHIPATMDYHSFREYFSQFGAIVDCNLMMDRETGQHRGFGFVTYEDSSSVQTVVSQPEPHSFDGQELEVKIATQKKDRASTYVGDRPNYGQRQQYNNYGQNQGGGYNGGGGGMGNMGMGNMGNMGMGGGDMMGGMGGMGGMNGMGGGNMGMGGMGGGAMNPMAGMGGMGGGQAGGFDPYAMAQFFKQMGWGNFNPMMAMQQGMMNGGGGGMGMGGMDPSAMMGMMGNMGGMAGGGANMGGGMGAFSPSNANFGGGGMAGMPSTSLGGGGGGSGSVSGGDNSTPGGATPMSAGSQQNKNLPRGPRGGPAMGRGAGGMRGGEPPANAPTGPASMRDSSQGAGPMRGNNRPNQRDHPYR